MLELFANELQTTIVSGGNTAPAPGTTETWTAATATGWPVAVAGVSGFRLRDPALPTEKILVTATSGVTWTVTRGAEGTTPVAHASGGFTVQQVITAGFLNGIMSALVPTAVQTAAYTASPGDEVLCDTTSGAFTVTLPTAPPDKSIVAVRMIRQSGGSPQAVTVARGGTDTFDNTTATTRTVSLVLQGGVWQYVTALTTWVKIAGELPLAQLDARYVLGPANYAGHFGDGSDGAVTFDGTTTILGVVPSASTYTLTRDIFCTTITVNNAVTVIPNGFKIFFTVSLTNNGTIAANGSAGAANGTAGGATGGSGSVGTGRPGGAGQTTAGSAGTSLNGAGGGTAGTGGTGASGAGGAGGTVGATGSWWFKSPAPVLVGASLIANANVTLNGGPGGGGGGGDGTVKGGGGGAGGGVVALLGPSIVNNGTISANGGGGGTPASGNAGGGGGATGGLVLTYTLAAPTGSGTFTAAAGTGGGHTGTGTSGGNGSAGLVLNQVLV